MWAYSLADLCADLEVALRPHGIRVEAVFMTGGNVTIRTSRNDSADFEKQFALPDAMLSPIVGQRLIKLVLDWYDTHQ
jgi:hypothetical protein